MLDLAPENEAFSERGDAREGVSVDTFLRRILAPQPAVAMPAVAAPTSDEIRGRFLELLALPKEEIVRRNAPSIALLDAQMAEAAKATGER